MTDYIENHEIVKIHTRVAKLASSQQTRSKYVQIFICQQLEMLKYFYTLATNNWKMDFKKLYTSIKTRNYLKI